VSDVYAPLSGTITAINHALDDTPELVNSDPYGEGWFAEIEMSDASELDAMMDKLTYESHIS
jgi:glycine cleavage system H protein